MDLQQAMQERRSIRGFKKDPVSRELLEEVIALANRAPSSMNTQPWHLHVLTGEPLEKVREGNSTRMLEGIPPDKERRRDWVMRGFRQFDAPVSIVVCFDKSLDDNGTIAHFDLGAVTYGLVLAAWSKGLGSVINGQGIMQSPVVREHAQIPDDQVIMTCVALGWPDESFSANDVVSVRRPVEELARFVGFDD